MEAHDASHRCKKLSEWVMDLVRCLIVQLEADYTKIVIHTYQSYCTCAHREAIRLLHLAIETHTVFYLG